MRSSLFAARCPGGTWGGACYRSSCLPLGCQAAQRCCHLSLVAACQPDSLAAQRRCHISLVMIATWFPGGTELVPTIAHHGCRLHLRLHREDPNYRSPFMPHYSQSAHGVVPVTARHECHLISRRCTATTKHRLPRLPPAAPRRLRDCAIFVHHHCQLMQNNCVAKQLLVARLTTFNVVCTHEYAHQCVRAIITCVPGGAFLEPHPLKPHLSDPDIGPVGPPGPPGPGPPGPGPAGSSGQGGPPPP